MKRTLVLSVLILASCEPGRPQRDPAVVALQVGLLERVARDQSVRDSAFLPGTLLDSTMLGRMRQVDRDNTLWLRDQIATHGWPSRAKVGEAASRAAFLIVQHATHDPTFQRQMLDTLTRALAKGEVDGESYALLYDRVQSQVGRPQRYGTQAKLVGRTVVFERMEDSLRVDSLRATVGLPSLAVYRKTLDSVYLGARKQP